MLLLSEKESFGLVVLEAMACKVPAIGTNTGGIPEVIIDGETGFICEIGDTETISAKAIQILTDEKLQKKMGEASLHRARKYFSQETIVAKYEDIYYSVKNEGKVE
jgi:glycosyltransferase involved in cell wall biosynthesis